MSEREEKLTFDFVVKPTRDTIVSVSEETESSSNDEEEEDSSEEETEEINTTKEPVDHVVSNLNKRNTFDLTELRKSIEVRIERNNDPEKPRWGLENLIRDGIKGKTSETDSSSEAPLNSETKSEKKYYENEAHWCNDLRGMTIKRAHSPDTYNWYRAPELLDELRKEKIEENEDQVDRNDCHWLDAQGLIDYCKGFLGQEKQETIAIYVRARNENRNVELYELGNYQVTIQEPKQIADENIPGIRKYKFIANPPLESLKHFNSFTIRDYKNAFFEFNYDEPKHHTKTEPEVNYSEIRFNPSCRYSEEMNKQIKEMNQDIDILDINNLASVVSDVLTKISRERIESIMRAYSGPDEDYEEEIKKATKQTQRFKQLYDLFLTELDELDCYFDN